MGGGQSQESPTVVATRNSADQRIGGRDVSSRKSAGGGMVPPSTTSSSSQVDSSRRKYFVVDDGRKGERGGGESDDSPSARHQSLSQPASSTRSGNSSSSNYHHPPHPPPPPSRSSHSHSHAHHHHHLHHGNGHAQQQRPHPPHRQQRQHHAHHHNHRPPPPPIPDTFPPVNMELSMPVFTSSSSSRTQPMANEPVTESLHPEFGLFLPSSSASSNTRHRRFYEAGNTEDLQLDLSMASLSRRLREVGLLAEDSGGNGVSGGSGNGGSGSSSSSRRHHRPRRHHSHSSHSGRSRHHLGTHGPVVLVRGLSAKMTCPLCSKEFSSADLEEHLLTCMTKPRVRYNVDTLQQDSGECSICLEDMLAGEQIARLPCLCIYHLQCIKQWYKVNPTCPEHPDFTA